jgi:hypothetical protein
MKRLSELGFLFTVVAVLELGYALVGLLPPGWIGSVTGWELSADGQWITKLFAVALLSQAWVAWTLRRQPHLGVAIALAFYQLASATADWVMWIVLREDGVFTSATAKALVLGAIPTHYLLGLLLLGAVRSSRVYARSSEAATSA